jgi:predicted DNA-binding transcriptional regulator YafY
MKRGLRIARGGGIVLEKCGVKAGHIRTDAREGDPMPRKRDPYQSPAMKVLGLHGLLLFTGRTYSLAQLARVLDCSKQTVLRGIEQLERSHQLELESWVEGRQRWYKAKTPARKPNVTLDPESIQHLLLCRDMVWHLLPDHLREEIGRSLQHATVLLPDFDEREEALRPLGEARPKGTIDYSKKQDVIADLLEALRGHRVVRMRYRPGHNRGTRSFVVAPLRLIAYREGLYVRCRFAARRSDPDAAPPVLHLAVHRIQSLTLTDETFDPGDEPPAPGLRGAADPRGATFGFMPGPPFRVRVAFSPNAAAYVAERTWSDDQTLTRRPDGGVVLEFTATSAFEVLAWVLGFGAEAELLAPQDLRTQMRQKLASMLEPYLQRERAPAGR